jgi:SM-20-related protein
MAGDRNPGERPLLDLALLASSKLQQVPFQWARVSGLIDQRILDTLCNEFPTSGFQETVGRSFDKTYRMFVRTLLARQGAQLVLVDSLSAPWQRLCSELSGGAYRAAMEHLTGLALSSHSIEITLWVYDQDCWLAPHCDKPAKAISHIFYFSQSWSRSLGGNLRILRSAQLFDCAEEVLPVAGDSVVLVRSDRSWHAVTPVSGELECHRRSLQVIFWAPEGSK